VEWSFAQWGRGTGTEGQSLARSLDHHVAEVYSDAQYDVPLQLIRVRDSHAVLQFNRAPNGFGGAANSTSPASPLTLKTRP
jgi:hypothetical protein